MRRAVLTGTVILLMGFCMSARADLVPVNVDGLTFHASTADEQYSANNWFNQATSWIEDDSRSAMTAVMSSNNAVGLALKGASGVHNGENAYWGGIVSFTSLQYSWNGPGGGQGGISGFNSEVTAAFWGLQFGAIQTLSGIATGGVHESEGLYNIKFDGTGTASFNIYFTGGEFKVSYQHPANDFPGSAPALYPGTAPGQNVDFKDASTTNAAWNTATNGDFLLSGKLNANNFSFDGNYYSAVATITLTNLNTNTPIIVPTSSGLISPSEFTKTGGDLASLVNPFHNPDSIDAFSGDGQFQITNFGVTYGFKKGNRPTSWVGDGGSDYLAATSQGTTDAAEFMDDTLIRVQLQTPEVSAILYLAPTVFGFLGFSIRRRRKTS